MTFDLITKMRKVNNRLAMDSLQRSLTWLMSLALFFLFVGFIVSVTGAQNPNCAELKKRLDDATRAYQVVLTQSQSIDKNYMSYHSNIRKLQDDLTVNNKRKALAERDIAEAQLDRANCERKPADACANVSYRIDVAEKRLTDAKTMRAQLEAELSLNQRRLETTKVTLAAASALLTSAQQDLDEANKAYAAASCGSENRKR